MVGQLAERRGAGSDALCWGCSGLRGGVGMCQGGVWGKVGMRGTWKGRIALETLRKHSLASVGWGWFRVGGLQEQLLWTQCPFGAL